MSRRRHGEQGGDRTGERRVNTSLTARVARLRLQDWGRLLPRRKQRLAMFLDQLIGDDSYEAVSRTAIEDGVPSSSARAIWYLIQMRDLTVAEQRERVNLFLVAYLLERYGSSLQEAWQYMTAEDTPHAGGEQQSPDAQDRATARELGDLYLLLRQRDPAKARQLAEFARFIVSDDLP